MNTSIIKVFLFNFFALCLFVQCKTNKEALSSTDEMDAPMIVRVLLKDGHNGKHMESTYKAYSPKDVKSASRSENWYRVIFSKPNNKAQLMAQMRSDAVILKVETDENLGTSVQGGKSLKSTKTKVLK